MAFDGGTRSPSKSDQVSSGHNQRDIQIPNNSQSPFRHIQTKWSDDDSIADTDSTLTRARIAQGEKQIPKPTLYKNHHKINRESLRQRQKHNFAMWSIHSRLIPREETASHLIQPNTAHDENAIGSNIDSNNETHTDWRAQARKSHRAGTLELEDMTEAHLAQRLFYQQELIQPVEHLQAATTQIKGVVRSRELRIKALEAKIAEVTARKDHAEAECIRMIGKTAEVNNESRLTKT